MYQTEVIFYVCFLETELERVASRPTSAKKVESERPAPRTGSAVSRPASGRTGSTGGRGSGQGSRPISGRPSSSGRYDEGTLPLSDMDYTAEGE